MPTCRAHSQTLFQLPTRWNPLGQPPLAAPAFPVGSGLPPGSSVMAPHGPHEDSRPVPCCREGLPAAGQWGWDCDRHPGLEVFSKARNLLAIVHSSWSYLA